MYSHVRMFEGRTTCFVEQFFFLAINSIDVIITLVIDCLTGKFRINRNTLIGTLVSLNNKLFFSSLEDETRLTNH